MNQKEIKKLIEALLKVAEDTDDHDTENSIKAIATMLEAKLDDNPIQKLASLNTEPADFQVTIGQFESKKDLLEKLEKEVKVTSWAKDVIEQNEFQLSDEEKTFDLVVRSVKDLGFENGATLKEIFERAKSRGLDLVHPEAAAQLRLDYTDQPEGEYLEVAHEPITDSVGLPRLLFVDRHSDGRGLGAWISHLGDHWYSDCRFVFAARK